MCRFNFKILAIALVGVCCSAIGIADADTVPDPVMQFTNIPELPWSSFHFSAEFNTDGLLYVWDGSYVWRQNAVNADGFTQIGEITGNMSDAGPVQFTYDGTGMLLGNGEGGWGPYEGHPECAGRIFSMPIGGSVISQPVIDIDYHYDIAALPQQSTIAQAGHKYFVNYGWEYYMTNPKSWVGVLDIETGIVQDVVADIPGASGAIAVDHFGNLYACVGYGNTRGLIKRFSAAAVDEAFNTQTPLAWSAGVALNPSNYNNNSAAGMFFDERGYLFVGGDQGLTVFRPDGSSGTFDVGGGSYSSVSYNPYNDQFLVLTSDVFTQDPIFIIYEASDFLSDIPGDANRDGRVDDIDATIMAANWGATGACWERGDFDDSGIVDQADADILAEYWLHSTLGYLTQTSNALASVPEPGILVLLLLGSVCFVLQYKLTR